MLAENDAQDEWALPDGWVWTTLGDITEPSEEKANPQEIQRTPYIGLEHIEKDTGKLLSFGYSNEVRSTKTVFHRGDLLYGKLRPYLNKVHIADFDGVCSTDILVFPKNPYASNRYLLYRLLSGDFVRYANLNVSGVQHPRTNFKILSKFSLALSPAAEQRRIVAEIETQFTRLDAAVAALKRVQANLRHYKAAVLKAACEGRLVPTEAELARAEGRDYEPADQLLARILAERRARWEAEHPGKRYQEPAPPDTEDLPELPEGWVWTTAEQIADQRLGKMLDKAKNKGTPRPYLRNLNVRWFGFDLTDIQYMRVMDKELDNVSVRTGDLVVCEGGEPGRAAVWDKRGEPMVIQKALHRVRPAVGISPWYLACRLASDASTGVLEKYFTGSTIKHFTGQSLRSYIFPLPPTSEQHRIVAEVERRLSVVAALEASVVAALARAGRLRQAVLKQAFEGRLVAQDPDDEPASVLLKRIKAERPRRERKSNRKEQPRQMELF